jgi:type I restriction enzyme S subunit
MGSEWQQKTLGDVIELKRGYDLSKTQRQVGDVPVISSAGISDTHSEAKVKGPGVVTGRYGTIGEVFYCDRDFWPLNTTLYVRDFKGNDEKFIYYFLKTIDYQQYSDKAAVPGVNRNHLHLAHVVIPSSVQEQRTIAHILGTLDDKIELNRRMNATLEAMAQALFQSWFVDFDPVIDNALAVGHPIPDALQERAAARAALGHRRQPLPAAIQSQFPSSFVRHEEMGWVPAGWAVARIGDVLELAYGKSLPATRRLEGSVPVYGSGGISGFHTEHFVNGPGIVVGRKGTVGSLYWVEDNFFPIDTVFFVINKSHTPLYWLYQTLKRIDIKSMGADSAVPGVNRNAVYAKPIIIPNVTAFKGYLAQIEPNNLKRRELEDQIKTLATLRDTLLPKLLSGAVRVAAAG